jgi:hypothetical protein
MVFNMYLLPLISSLLFPSIVLGADVASGNVKTWTVLLNPGVLGDASASRIISEFGDMNIKEIYDLDGNTVFKADLSSEKVAELENNTMVSLSTSSLPLPLHS